MENTEDSHRHRKKQKLNRELMRKRLKPNAVPTQFPNLASYLSEKEVKPRSSTTSSEQRFENASVRQEALNMEFFDQDKIQSISDIKAKLETNLLPTGFKVIFEDLKVQFINLKNLPSGKI